MGYYSDLTIDAPEVLCGLDLDKNGGDMLVCKSIPLVGLPRNPMTLFEMKLFDTYLGRINPQNPYVTEIKFEARELQELFGLERISNNDLIKALNNLMSRTVTVYEGRTRIMFTLLSTARLDYTDKRHTRLRTITLKCSEEAKKYIYNIKSIRYLKMSLARLVAFNSRHSYALYQYLLVNSFRPKWDVDINELKAMLGIPDKYADYRDFNKRVLQTAFDEINEKTDIKFTYEPIFKRNKIIKIQFHVTHTDEELEKKIETEEAQIEEPQIEEPVEPEEPYIPEEEAEDDDEFIGWDELITPSDSGQEYDERNFDEMLF